MAAGPHHAWLTNLFPILGFSWSDALLNSGPCSNSCQATNRRVRKIVVWSAEKKELWMQKSERGWQKDHLTDKGHNFAKRLTRSPTSQEDVPLQSLEFLLTIIF